MRLLDLARCYARTPKVGTDPIVHLVCGLWQSHGASTFCGKKVVTITTDGGSISDVCKTCTSSARYWGFR